MPSKMALCSFKHCVSWNNHLQDIFYYWNRGILALKEIVDFQNTDRSIKQWNKQWCFNYNLNSCTDPQNPKVDLEDNLEERRWYPAECSEEESARRPRATSSLSTRVFPTIKNANSSVTPLQAVLLLHISTKARLRIENVFYSETVMENYQIAIHASGKETSCMYLLESSLAL